MYIRGLYCSFLPKEIITTINSFLFPKPCSIQIKERSVYYMDFYYRINTRLGWLTKTPLGYNTTFDVENPNTVVTQKEFLVWGSTRPQWQQYQLVSHLIVYIYHYYIHRLGRCPPTRYQFNFPWYQDMDERILTLYVLNTTF